MTLIYLRSYLCLYVQYGDHAAAKRKAHFDVLAAKKSRAERAALKGKQ